MALPRCSKCLAPSSRKGANWRNVLADIETLGTALSEACETMEQIMPGWERSPQWKRFSKALSRAGFWRRQQEEASP